MRSVSIGAPIHTAWRKWFWRTLSFALALQMALFSTVTTTWAIDPPVISSITVTAGAGKTANDVAGTVYTNDQRPTVAASFSAGTNPVDDTAAVLRINGVPNPTTTVRDSSGISYQPSSNLAPNSYAVTVNVKDTIGTKAVQSGMTVVVDTTAPTTPVITAPAAGTYNNPTPVVTGTAEANAAVTIYDSATPVATIAADGSGNFSVATSILADGSHALTAMATDYAGNVSAVSVAVSYNVDTAPPTVPVPAAEANTGNHRPTLEWAAVAEANDYHIQIDDNDDFSSPLVDEFVPSTSYTPGFDLPFGSIYWRVSARDLYSNESAFSAADSFMIDALSPTVASVILSDPSPVKAGTLTVTINFSEDLDPAVAPIVAFGSVLPYDEAGVAQTSFTGSVWTGSMTVDASTGDGTKTMSISNYQDAAGNVGLTDTSFGFIVDTASPLVALNGPAEITLEAGVDSYTEAGAVWTDAQDGSGSAAVGGTVDTNTVGDYTVTYNYTDAAGNAAVQAVRTVHVIDTLAPVFSGGQSPADGLTIGDTLAAVSGSFTDAGSGLDTASLRLTINGIDITSGISWTGGTFTCTPAFAWNDGSYTVEVDLADNDGNRSDLAAWTFTVSSAPAITSIAASGGRVVAGYINNTNTGFQVSGTVPADNSGIQTVRLYSNGSQLSSTIVLLSNTVFTINLDPAEFSTLTATGGGKSLTVDREGFYGNTSIISGATGITVDMAVPVAPGTSIILQQNVPGANDTILGVAGAGTPDTVGAYVYDMADNLIGSAAVNPDGSFGPVSIGDNLYDQVQVAFRDAAGNESTKTGGFFNLIVAPGAPVIYTPASPAYSQNDTPAVAGSIFDIGTTVNIYKDGLLAGSGPVDGSGNFSIILPSLGADGSYTLTARAADSAGNLSLDSTAATYVLDRLSPVSTGHNPGASTNIGLSPVSVTWSDGSSGFADPPTMTLQINGIDVPAVWDNATDTMTYTPGGDFDEGTYTVFASIADMAGNEGSTTFEFTVDTLAPVITLLGNSSLTIEFGTTYTDAGAEALDGHDGDLTSQITTTSNVNTSAIGDYTVSYDVSDAAGNAAVTVIRNVYVRDTIPPTVDAGSDRVTNGTISQTCTAADFGSGIVSYLWTKESGPDPVAISAPTAAATNITVVNDGTYTIRCAVTDNAGNSAYDEFVMTWDDTDPTVIVVGTAKADGSYKEGETIDITVQYSEDVVVDTAGGTPTLALNSGGTASYLSIAGNTLTFRYTVGAGQASADLDYTATTDLSLNGGTVRDQAANDADNTLPAAGTFAGAHDIVIDTSAPAITIGAATTSNANPARAKAGDTVSINFTVSEALIADPAVNFGGQPMTKADNTYLYSRLLDGTETEGSASFIINATDLAGNSGSDSSAAFTTDFTAPITTDNVPAGWSNVTVTVTLSVAETGSTPATTLYSLDGLEPSLTYTVPLVISAEGSTELRYKSADAAGNEETVKVKSIRIDTANPPILPTSSVIEDLNSDSLDDDFANNKQIKVAWPAGSDTLSGIDHYLLRIRRGSTGGANIITDYNVGNTNSYTLTPDQAALLDEDIFYPAIAVVDAAGNASSYRNSDGITIDLTAPVVALTGITPVTVERGTGYTDAGAAWTDAVDGSGGIVTSDTVDTNVAGTYILHYNHSDQAGNAALEVIRTVIVEDTIAPDAPTINPVIGFQANSVDLSGTAEVGSTVNLTLANGATVNDSAVADGSGNWSKTVDISALNDGTVTVSATASDVSGNTGPAANITFSKDAVDPSFGSIAAVPASAKMGAAIIITFTASEELAGNPAVTVGGAAASYVSNSGLNYTYNYSVAVGDTAGDKIISISGTDLAGNYGTSTGNMIFDFTAPTIGSGTPAGSISNKFPTIEATVSDTGSGVNASTVVMRINGVAVSSSFNPATGIVSFTPSRALSARTYVVTIDAKDNAGNSATRYSFTFTVN